MPGRTLALLSALIVAVTTYMVGARFVQAKIEMPERLHATPSDAAAIDPHFVTPPALSTDNGALHVEARIAGLGERSVRVVVSATAVTTCADGPSVQEILTATRPAVIPDGGIADLSIITEPVGFGCADGNAQTQFRDVVVTVYQNDAVILEQILNRGG